MCTEGRVCVRHCDNVIAERTAERKQLRAYFGPALKIQEQLDGIIGANGFGPNYQIPPPRSNRIPLVEVCLAETGRLYALCKALVTVQKHQYPHHTPL